MMALKREQKRSLRNRKKIVLVKNSFRCQGFCSQHDKTTAHIFQAKWVSVLDESIVSFSTKTSQTGWRINAHWNFNTFFLFPDPFTATLLSFERNNSCCLPSVSEAWIKWTRFNCHLWTTSLIFETRHSLISLSHFFSFFSPVWKLCHGSAKVLQNSCAGLAYDAPDIQQCSFKVYYINNSENKSFLVGRYCRHAFSSTLNLFAEVWTTSSLQRCQFISVRLDWWWE